MSGAESQGAAGGEGGDSAAPSADVRRYSAAVQGAKACANLVDRALDDQQLFETFRMGINTALRDLESLSKLLVAKGLITGEEYQQAMADGMEQLVRDYAGLISAKFRDFDVRVCDGKLTLAPRKAGPAGNEGGVKP